jgi:hypothetical protein
MAIFSINHKSVGRSTHKPGTAAAHIRYICRAKTARIILTNGFPNDWPSGKIASEIRKQEEADRKNARIIDKIMVALPIELTENEREGVVLSFIHAITEHKVPWIAAFHDLQQDADNPHCHIVIRDRHLETGKPVCGLTDKGSTTALRILWEEVLNRALKDGGYDVQVDRRSLKERGIDRKPQIHVGPKAKAMLDQGIKLSSKDKIDRRGREIRYTEIDDGLTRYEHNQLIKTQNEEGSS